MTAGVFALICAAAGVAAMVLPGIGTLLCVIASLLMLVLPIVGSRFFPDKITITGPASVVIGLLTGIPPAALGVLTLIAMQGAP